MERTGMSEANASATARSDQENPGRSQAILKNGPPRLRRYGGFALFLSAAATPPVPGGELS